LHGACSAATLRDPNVSVVRSARAACAQTSTASTRCWNVSASYSKREQVRSRLRAVGMCRHHTARGLHARKRVPQVRAVGMCRHHTAPGLHARKTSTGGTSCWHATVSLHSTGNEGLRWRLSPRPAGLRCKISRTREVCARGGGAVAATQLCCPRCCDDGALLKDAGT